MKEGLAIDVDFVFFYFYFFRRAILNLQMGARALIAMFTLHSKLSKYKEIFIWVFFSIFSITVIEHLPQELRDRFTDMREMDLSVQSMFEWMHKNAAKYWLN